MLQGLLLTYLIGLVITAVLFAWTLPKMPKEETEDLHMPTGVLLIFLWPVLWILVGIYARNQNR